MSPPDPAPCPDPALYIAGAAFQRERQTLFAESWLLFAASAQLAQAGDFITHSIGGWPLLAVRGEDGVARAFHNVCRHQDMPVLEESTGNRDILRCRYHGWAYCLDGTFYDAPTRLMPAGPTTQYALRPAELVERGGFCLVRVRPGELAPRELTVPGGVFAGAVTTDIDANWKAVIEALLDAGAWRHVSPLALLGEIAPGVSLVRQIAPRSFLRTRLVDLIFTPDGALPAADVKSRAALDTAVAEACHAGRAAGDGRPPSPAAAAFLQRVAAACAGP